MVDEVAMFLDFLQPLQISPVDHYSNSPFSHSGLIQWVNLGSKCQGAHLTSTQDKDDIFLAAARNIYIKFNVNYSLWVGSGSRTADCKSMPSITRL
jgi:hypothetical protein